MSGPLMTIGVPQETIDTAKDAILDVLQTSAGDDVKIAALNTLAAVATITSVNVSGCTFTSLADEEED